MDNIDFSHLPPLFQAAATVGVAISAFFLWMKGKWNDPTLAITQTRAEATEAFVKETKAIQESLNSNKAEFAGMKDTLLRSLTTQEEMVRLLRELNSNDRVQERVEALIGRSRRSPSRSD